MVVLLRNVVLALGLAACSVQADERVGRVELGVDVLLAKDAKFLELVKDRRVGLITNPSGVDGALIPTADRLAHDRRVQLVQLYGPEHGIRGDVAAGDQVGDERDAETGVAVQSLYGKSKRPSAESLAALDVVLFDIQDVGSRTYTYISTLGEALEACAEAGKPLVVLDRPNPIGGRRFEGPLIEERWRSFIGWGPMPVTHGMTVGEVARYFNDVLAIGCELHVVPMRGWKRDMAWEDTGLSWTQTSPHIPNATQAHLYVTTGMIASSTTNLSDGVGSTMPFELVGAEFFDAIELEIALNELELPGVRFQALAYKPFYGKFKDKPLRGVRLRLTNPKAYRPLHTALAILHTIKRLHPESFALADDDALGKHWGDLKLREQFASGATVEAIERSWAAGLAEFERARAKALLY
jgi:uncharacterized protein YbbC (DUF1343 family)